MIAASTSETAAVLFGNRLIPIATGTRLEFGADGSLRLWPPVCRHEMRDGAMALVPVPEGIWTLYPDGRAAEMPAPAGEA